jgi:hypothetical protein
MARRYVLVKKSRMYTCGIPYNDSKHPRGKLYKRRRTAERVARQQAYENPVGFDVVTYRSCQHVAKEYRPAHAAKQRRKIEAEIARERADFFAEKKRRRR